MRIHRFSLITAGLVLAVASTARAEDYPIKLYRPSAGGDKGHLVGKASSSHTMTMAMGDMPATPAEAQEITAAIDAEQEVLKTDQGHPVKVSYKIAKLTGAVKKMGADQKLNLPAKGDVVLAEYKDGKAVFSVGGSQLGENETLVLGSLIELNDAKTASDDDASFGTTDRKKVGDQWKVNPEAVVKDLGKKGMVVAPEKVDGTVKLAEVKDVAGVPAMKLALDVKLTSLTLPIPDPIKVDSSVVHVTGTMTVPTDPSLSWMGETTKMDMSIAMSMSQGGQSAKMNSTDTMTKEETLTPIGK